MKSLQDLAILIIPALLRGELFEFDLAQQESLAMWALMTSVSVEYTNPDPMSRGISRLDIKNLIDARRNGASTSKLSHWQIAIGHYLGSPIPVVWCDHHSFVTNGTSFGKSMTIVIGELAIQLWVNYLSEPVSDEWRRIFGLQLIWPAQENVQFPLWLSITDPMLKTIALEMRRRFEQQTLGYISL